jgi:nucleoside triphosphate diphosphatase
MTQAREPRPIARLLEIMARLRDPDRGCPWDLQQDFRTIAPHTIEEAYEVADAIERGDFARLVDELGDLLFQVVFYARMAAERGLFDFDAIAAGISEKMVRRHPHVFGTARIDDAEAQTQAWEEHKDRERRAEAAAAGRAPSVLDGVVIGLPALSRAVKLQKRAQRVGFDWRTPAEVLGKIAEETQEVRREVEAAANPARLEDEIGDLLFAVVNLARHLRVDPEGALRHANAKFERRFRAVEERLAASDRPVGIATLDAMEEAWAAVKEAERDE